MVSRVLGADAETQTWDRAMASFARMRFGSLSAVRLSRQRLAWARKTLFVANQCPRTAARIVTQARSNIWLTPPDAAPVIRRILVPMDHSKRSTVSLQVAADLARRLKLSSVIALHVYFNDVLVVHEPAALALAKDTSDAHIGFLSQLELSGVKVEPLIVEGRSAENVVQWVADRHAVDLIVLGHRKRTPFEEWFARSMESQLIRSAPCPLLIMGSDRHEEVRPRGVLARLFHREDMRFS
jgi:nucleotide-binding universal stress UspA family protein